MLKALMSFEKAKDWADMSKAIQKLQKTISKHKGVGVIPEKLLLSKRLAQTLLSSLPAGLHKKALTTYQLLFADEDSLQPADLPLFAAPVFKLFPEAAIDVKPIILEIIDKYFVARLTAVQFRPSLGGFLCSMLPALEEENSELYPSVLKTVQTVHQKFTAAGMLTSFMFHLWESCKYHSPSRVAALTYLSTIIPRSATELAHDLDLLGGSKEHPPAAAGISSALRSNEERATRLALDLLNQSFRLSEIDLVLPEECSITIVADALVIMAKQELALTRRVSKWFNGRPDDKADPEYYSQHAAKKISTAFKRLMADTSTPKHTVLKLMDMLGPETQEAVITQYTDLMVSLPREVSHQQLQEASKSNTSRHLVQKDALKSIKNNIFLDYIHRLLSHETSNSAELLKESTLLLNQIRVLSTGQTTSDDMDQTSDKSMQKQLLIATCLRIESVLQINCTDLEDASAQLQSIGILLDCFKLLLSKYRSGLCREGINDVFRQFSTVVYSIIDILGVIPFKGVSSTPLIVDVLRTTFNSFRENISTTVAAHKSDSSSGLPHELLGIDPENASACPIPNWLDKTVSLCQHKNNDISVIACQFIIDLVCSDPEILPEPLLQLLFNNSSFKNTLVILWDSLSPDNKNLYTACKQLVQVYSKGGKWSQTLKSVMVEDLETQPEGSGGRRLPKISDLGFSRFCIMWDITQQLGFLDPDLLKEPLRMVLDTLESESPLERRKGASFLANYSQCSVSLIIDPYFEILFDPQNQVLASSLDASDHRRLNYVINALFAVINNSPPSLVSAMLTETAISPDIKAAFSQNTAYSHFVVSEKTPSGQPIGPSYLSLLCSVCLSVINTGHSDMGVKCAELLALALSKGENSISSMLCIGIVSHIVDIQEQDPSTVDPSLFEVIVTVFVILDKTSTGCSRYTITNDSFISIPSDQKPLATTVPEFMTARVTNLLLDCLKKSADASNLHQYRQWCLIYRTLLPLVAGASVGSLPSFTCSSRDAFISILGRCTSCTSNSHSDHLTAHTLCVAEATIELLGFIGDYLSKIAVECHNGVVGGSGDIHPATGGTAFFTNFFSSLTNMQSVGSQNDNSGANSPVSPEHGEREDAASLTSSAIRSFCKGYDEFLRHLNKLRQVISKNPDILTNLAAVTQRLELVSSNLLHVMYSMNAWHFFNGVLFLWAEVIASGCWKPFVFSNRQSDCPELAESGVLGEQQGYLNLLLLTPSIGVEEVTSGMMEVAFDIVERYRTKKPGLREHHSAHYDVYSADIITQYIDNAPTDKLSRLPKLMPMILQWMRGLSAVNIAHPFAHPAFLRLLSTATKRLTDMASTPVCDPASRYYLQDKKNLKEVFELFNRLLENVPRLMVSHVAQPVDSNTEKWNNTVDLTAVAQELVTEDLHRFKSPFLTPGEKVSPVILSLHQLFYSSILKLTEDNSNSSGGQNNTNGPSTIPKVSAHIRKVHASLKFIIKYIKTFPNSVRALRPVLTEHVYEPGFFKVDTTALVLWRKLLSALVVGADSAAKEMIDNILGRIQLPTGVGNVFRSADREAVTRARGLRHLAYALICCDSHVSNAHLFAKILEKLIETVKHYSSFPIVERQVLLCFRAIASVVEGGLYPHFWPLAVSELIRVLNDKKADRSLLIDALKLIDLLRVKATSDYHSYRWIFIDSEAAFLKKEAAEGDKNGLAVEDGQLSETFTPLLQRMSQSSDEGDSVENMVKALRLEQGENYPVLCIPARLYDGVLKGYVTVEELSNSLQTSSVMSDVTDAPIPQFEADLAELHLNRSSHGLDVFSCFLSPPTLQRADSITHVSQSSPMTNSIVKPLARNTRSPSSYSSPAPVAPDSASRSFATTPVASS
eukprot:TRINITY_DN4501_c0_g1_i1.p1 TRINITY_DN4501_c0_g1~~TRINITY_DN4501_c0_g1_i1.p1  ORF type:complete len:1897 (+),score=295.09 TRINITY_DN4501_c0_g1_i1:129-5693(+)